MCMVAWCGVQGGHSSGNRDRLDSDSDGSEPGDVPDVNTTETQLQQQVYCHTVYTMVHTVMMCCMYE